MKHLNNNSDSFSRNQPNVVLDLKSHNTIKTVSNIDFQNASIRELSSIIVSDMIESVKTDLSSIRIENQKKSK